MFTSTRLVRRKAPVGSVVYLLGTDAVLGDREILDEFEEMLKSTDAHTDFATIGFGD